MKKWLRPAFCGLWLWYLPLSAANLVLPNAPLFVPGQNIPPLVMLVMGRDHTLYYEAYNDATDLDGDGVLDTHFKSSITYYGYFDSNKCYNYESNIFVPKSLVTNASCAGSTGRWHGNFLNYLTTSRMDALRKVLYGGMRYSSTTTSTVLERAYIPQDAHSWGKTWNPVMMAAAGMKLSDYAPLSDTNGYFFASTSLLSDVTRPVLRVLELNKYMSQDSLGLGSFSSVKLCGGFNSWCNTATGGSNLFMSAIGDGKWQAQVTFGSTEASRAFKFYISDKWAGDNKSSAGAVDGIIDYDAWGKSADNIVYPVAGAKWIVLNSNTRRYTVQDYPETDASYNNQTDARLYIWNWVSKEQPVAGSSIDNFSGAPTITDYTVRIQTCVNGLRESNCQKYENGSYYPVGLLQKKGGGDNPDMYFGLISGSYKNNTKGGVLRAKIGKMDDEIDRSTGQFKTRSDGVNGPGIISTLNKLKITKFSNFSYSDCGWIVTRAINNSECSSWGNPIAEMLYESLRYFAGAATPSTDFTVGAGDELSLPEDSWSDPFAANSGFAYCSQPVNLIISDVGTSYDSDQIPGSAFTTYTPNPALPNGMRGLNVSSWTKTISDQEGLSNQVFFIGEAGNDNAGVPTAKAITNLSEVRGLAPMEPTKQGSYYAAGLAYYAHQTDINPRLGGQKPKTVVVAMASHLPEIKIRTGKGVVSLIPFAKSVKGKGKDGDIKSGSGNFQPTNGIVDFYVEKITPTEGAFRVNFEDVEQGADHDMDMIVLYQYQVLDDGSLQITLKSEYAAGSVEQHAGYVISGTTQDGVYLDVYDIDTGVTNQTAYYMDTPLATESPYPNNSRTVGNNKASAMPLIRSRIFTADTNKSAANFLPSPLWYAAKWGNFIDKNNNGIPDSGEWDSQQAGQPDNYFLVTTASNLEDQLQRAMDNITDNSRSGTSVSYPSSDLSSDSMAYSAVFEGKYWSGDVKAYAISSGVTQTQAAWSANEMLSQQAPSSRVIFTMDSDGSKRVFAVPTDELGSNTALSQRQIAALMAEYPATGSTQDRLPYLQALVGYLRGDRTYEREGSQVPGTVLPFRKRNGVLGDIVHSTPVYGVSVGDKQPFMVFGANDGMVHVLNADTGEELLAYIPSTSYRYLSSLASTNYSHRYFVDGTIKVITAGSGTSARTLAVGTFGLGGQGAWALDLTELKQVNANAPEKYLLWELTDQKAPQIGYMSFAPALLSGKDKLGAMTVRAVFGNGYNSSEVDNATDIKGNGALLVVDVLTGNLLRTLDTGVGIAEDPTNTSRPNALSEPVFSDWDRDGIADRLYAGDLFGNLWAVDVSDDDVSKWSFMQDSHNNIVPLFTAKSSENKPQPISVRPSVAFHPQGGVLVVFGTGKYLETSDLDVDNQPTQSVYAIWDKHGRTSTVSRTSLLQQTITAESGNPKTRTTSTNTIDWNSHNGWYLDLSVNSNNRGERVVTKVLVRNSVAAITSMIPDSDICKGGGYGWYTEVNVYEGHNQGLEDRSAELARIPSDPVFTFHTNKDGDVEMGNKVQVDGGEVHTPPTVTERTSLNSWQQLY